MKIPETLRQRLREGKVIPFVGAGVPMSVRGREGGEPLFPSWREMLERAAGRLEGDGDEVRAGLVRNFLSLKPPKYLEAAQYAREGMGASDWYDSLRAQLDKSPESAAPESLELAKAVWKLGSRLVITTNFDRVMHWASPEPGGPASWDIDAPAELAELLRRGLTGPTVWHLHGQIHNATKIILTPGSFSLLYPGGKDGESESPYRAALQTLRALLVSHSFLFIGFSLDDLFFRRQLDDVNQIYAGAGGPHYVLMREADVALGLKDERSVKAVTFPEFGEPLLGLMRELGAAAAREEPRPAATPRAGGKETTAKETPAVADYDPRHPPFFVPFRQKGDQVIGREKALEAVREQLTSGRRTAIGQTASFQGLGGLGKTQLAVEYAYRFRDTYPNGVIWLNADQDIDAQLTELSEKARWVSPLSEHKYKLEVAQRRLRTYSDCLIIFDNLEDPQAIEDYLPEPQADPHILVTSRTPQPDFPLVPLDPLNETLSIELLYQEAGRTAEGGTEEEAARLIAEALGGLPLALELAGAYLRYRQVSFRQYLDLLQKNLKAATTVRFSAGGFTRHETDLYSTLKINEEVFEEEPRLRDILDLLTWSGTAPMGISLMCKLLDVESPVELTGALGLGTLLRMLQKSPDAESYAIHRLLAEVRRTEIPLDGRKEWANQMCMRVGDWFQERRREFSNLPMLEAEIDHLKAWQEQASMYVPDQISRLIWLEAYPPIHRGRHREAKALVENALRMFEQNHVKDDELKPKLLNDLGTCHRGLQEPQIALNYYKKALEICQSTVGDYHPDTADSFSGIGSIYNGLDDSARGLDYHKRSLDIRLTVLGERNQDISLSYNNISVSYAGLREYEQALEYAEKSLSLTLDMQGGSHPNVAYALINVGTFYNNMGNVRHAQEYVQKGLKLFRELLGNQHVDTIKAAVNMATLSSNLGRPRQGLQLLEEMLRKVPQDNPRYDWLKQEYFEARNKVPSLRQVPTSGQGRKKKKKKKP
ncbi:MAG TPA: tetratricopeptide repeat protein [Pyrinomonadaceae bacterium]